MKMYFMKTPVKNKWRHTIILNSLIVKKLNNVCQFKKRFPVI